MGILVPGLKYVVDVVVLYGVIPVVLFGYGGNMFELVILVILMELFC